MCQLRFVSKSISCAATQWSVPPLASVEIRLDFLPRKIKSEYRCVLTRTPRVFRFSVASHIFIRLIKQTSFLPLSCLCLRSNSIKLVNLCNAQNVANVDVEANIMDQHGAMFHSDFYDMFVLSAEAAAAATAAATAADAMPAAASALPLLRPTTSAPLGAFNFRDTVVAHPTVLPVVLKNRTEYAACFDEATRCHLRCHTNAMPRVESRIFL